MLHLTYINIFTIVSALCIALSECRSYSWEKKGVFQKIKDFITWPFTNGGEIDPEGGGHNVLDFDSDREPGYYIFYILMALLIIGIILIIYYFTRWLIRSGKLKKIGSKLRLRR